MKNLVIVESPAKAKTIQKFLGADYKVLSSYGHIRDLKKGDFSQDMGSDFEIEYEVPADKAHLVATLRSEARKADTVWLASDEDREGEAIAWHLFKVLELTPENTRRIVFHEITKPAILHAIANPRSIDVGLVDAQQARRVLDRIVGFELSPVLWRKIKPALSAGRVQSVAVRLLCEREAEIRAFTPEAYFRISARVALPASPDTPFRAVLDRHFSTEAESESFLNACAGAALRVESVAVKPLKRSPAPPFTTSTLQQEASRRLGFSVSQTMMVAQKLYESGFITYMRTDSLNLSSMALAALARQVETEFGADYVKTRRYHTSSKGAQEAHEAIRPTYPDMRRLTSASPQEQRLYDLIWKRAMASQMADAQLEKTTVDISISSRPERLEAQGETILFKGFMQVWDADSQPDTDMLPRLAAGDALTPLTLTATERFTQPQSRYSEATLVKKMEDLGIGRPSTYAPTISTIQSRDYVVRGESDGTPRPYTLLTLADGAVTRERKTENAGSDKGKLIPTDVGMVVNGFLTQHFPDILDYNFTARIEEKFDDIADGKLPWKREINDFYTGFHPSIERVSEMRTEHKAGERLLGTDPESGRPVSVKIGRFGPVAQIGDAAEEEKPRFASLQKGQSMASITLEEALALFRLPRLVGTYEDREVHAAIGRFGPYLRFGSMFVSIPKDLSPYTIGIDDAARLIDAKRTAEANRHIKDFGDELPGVQVLNGRFGPYIAYKAEGARRAVNYKLPKGEDPAALTAARVRELMAAQDAKKKK